MEQRVNGSVRKKGEKLYGRYNYTSDEQLYGRYNYTSDEQCVSLRTAGGLEVSGLGSFGPE